MSAGAPFGHIAGDGNGCGPEALGCLVSITIIALTVALTLHHLGIL